MKAILKRNQAARSKANALQKKAAAAGPQAKAAKPPPPVWTAGVNPFSALKAKDKKKVKSNKRGGCRRCRRRSLLEDQLTTEAAADFGSSSRSSAEWQLDADMQQQAFQSSSRGLQATFFAAAAKGAQADATLQSDTSFVDWSLAFPSIKNQGLCASGWAFAATALAEAAHFVNTGEIT